MTGPLWGTLPDKWRVGQIKTAATVTLGKMLQSKDSGSDVCAPYMRAANVQPDGVLALDDVSEMWFSEAELEQLSIRAGDVVVVEGGQGGFGRAAYVDEDLPGWGFQNSINRLRPIDDFDGRFIAFYLIALRASGFIRAYSNVVSMPHLTAEKLARIPMPLPPLDEQRAIADYLDRETARIDALVEEQQRLLEILRERRRATIEEGVSIVATSGARLKHIIRSVRQGWSPQCYAWPADGVETWAVLKAGAANGGRFRPMENKELPEDEIPRPDIVVTRGDLIVSRANTRELVGSAAVVENDLPRLMLCDKLYAFSLDESQADSRFVAAVLGSRRWRDLIELEATGASHSMLNISQSDIVNLPMPLPPVDDQRRILAHMDRETARIDQLVAETERFVELARQRRAALITAAVTGQVDVREMV
ncbi:restriction endonuclease subunit S [Kribbella sp. NBC_00709]|uniref:restriction endonuclease subunit S n=1 Tax=Kribbella sp. NBC_00709 TaxID=2975972 RepID=UPI002E2C5EF5|nr:restriction endonuclease subunit S [Kribbella sp. NBC_00709]